eukprot:8245217-Pyramimonas_sp.AAC.1
MHSRIRPVDRWMDDDGTAQQHAFRLLSNITMRSASCQGVLASCLSAARKAVTGSTARLRHDGPAGDGNARGDDSRVHVKWAVWSCKDAKEGLRADYRLWVRNHDGERSPVSSDRDIQESQQEVGCVWST